MSGLCYVGAGSGSLSGVALVKFMEAISTVGVLGYGLSGLEVCRLVRSEALGGSIADLSASSQLWRSCP